MTIKVLYVEDDSFNMNLVKKMVKVMGYTLIAAEDGINGIIAAERELPDVILMDIQLPDMNGLEVAQRLRESPITQHIPIVVLTADTTEMTHQLCVEAGCDGYLVKPVSKASLLRAVQQFAGAPSV